MPAIKCENNKWKWGENGSCIYDTQSQAEQDNKDYIEMEEDRDMTNLNRAGYNNAVELIDQGKVNMDDDWDFTASDSNELLGDDNWTNYAKWFLAYDDEKEEETKGHYGYPYGKDGEVYRKALIAIRQYSGRFNLEAIFEAAGRLLEMIEGEENSEKKQENCDDCNSITACETGCENKEVKSFSKNKIKIWDKKYNNSMEKRIFNIESRVEKREDGKEVVVGYASIYDSKSENLGGFYEYIDRGAFNDDLINKSDVRALINHDPNLILARNTSGTLKLSADEKGLKYEFSIPETSYGKDLAVNMRNGNLTQSSFAFVVKEDDWTTNERGEDVRTIKEIDSLHDISVVTYPAYRQAESDLVIAQRGLSQYKEKQKHKEEENDLVMRSLATLKIELAKRK